MRLKEGSDWKLVYSEYLKTAHWQRKRLETIAFYRGECANNKCKSMEQLEVHHTKEGYEELFAEIAGLHTICYCSNCHEMCHFREPAQRAINDPYILDKFRANKTES